MTKRMLKGIKDSKHQDKINKYMKDLQDKQKKIQSLSISPVSSSSRSKSNRRTKRKPKPKTKPKAKSKRSRLKSVCKCYTNYI